MQANVKAPAKAKAAKAAPAPATEKPVTLSLRAESLAAHDAAGFTGKAYAGLSKTRNAGNTKAPNTSTSKATPRTHAQLTERMHCTLREIAKAHGAKAFPLPGIDRGQAAIFLASGFFVPAGEAKATLSPDTLKRYA